MQSKKTLYDGMEMSVKELKEGLDNGEFYVSRVYYDGNKIDKSELTNHLDKKGHIEFYEDYDGYDYNGPIILKYIDFIIDKEDETNVR